MIPAHGRDRHWATLSFVDASRLMPALHRCKEPGEGSPVSTAHTHTATAAWYKSSLEKAHEPCGSGQGWPTSPCSELGPVLKTSSARNHPKFWAILPHCFTVLTVGQGQRGDMCHQHGPCPPTAADAPRGSPGSLHVQGPHTPATHVLVPPGPSSFICHTLAIGTCCLSSSCRGRLCIGAGVTLPAVGCLGCTGSRLPTRLGDICGSTEGAGALQETPPAPFPSPPPRARVTAELRGAGPQLKPPKTPTPARPQQRTPLDPAPALPVAC